MSRVVHTASGSDTVASVAARMRRLGVAALPVVDTCGRVVGIVSEVDLVRAGPWSADPSDPVASVARTPVRCLSPGTTVAGAAEVLLGAGLHRMPVVEGDSLVGIVSLGDLLAATLPDDLGAERERRGAGR